jgi:hypothetical protein
VVLAQEEELTWKYAAPAGTAGLGSVVQEVPFHWSTSVAYHALTVCVLPAAMQLLVEKQVMPVR